MNKETQNIIHVIASEAWQSVHQIRQTNEKQIASSFRFTSFIAMTT